MGKSVCPLCGGNIILYKTLVQHKEVLLKVGADGKPLEKPETEWLERCDLQEDEVGAFCSECDWNYNLYYRKEAAGMENADPNFTREDFPFLK